MGPYEVPRGFIRSAHDALQDGCFSRSAHDALQDGCFSVVVGILQRIQRTCSKGVNRSLNDLSKASIGCLTAFSTAFRMFFKPFQRAFEDFFAGL